MGSQGCDSSGRRAFRMRVVRKTTARKAPIRKIARRSGNRNTRQDDDVRKTNGIRFNGLNQQDLRKRLGCQQEWNKPGRLGTTPGAEITLQDVKFKRKKKKKKKSSALMPLL